MQPSQFELWNDDAEGRCYVGEFLDYLGDEQALRVLQVLEGYSRLTLADLIRDLRVRVGEDGLAYVRINFKKLRIRFFGCIVEGKIILVHGVKKAALKDVAAEHYTTARKRIAKIQKQKKP